jgi:hypothetical protein
VFWASLPAGRRSYAEVSSEFGVSLRTVEKHGRSAGWQERLRGVQAQAAARTDEELARAWADQLGEYEKLIEASFITYAQQLRAGGVRITASEFVGLVKLMLQLRGEPTARVELAADSGEWLALRTAILDALDAFPEARVALAEALEGRDGAGG